jgi:hypothetical protein
MSRLTEKKIIDIFQSTLNDKFVSEDVEYFKIGKKYFVLKVFLVKLLKQYQKLVTENTPKNSLLKTLLKIPY